MLQWHPRMRLRWHFKVIVWFWIRHPPVLSKVLLENGGIEVWYWSKASVTALSENGRSSNFSASASGFLVWISCPFWTTELDEQATNKPSSRFFSTRAMYPRASYGKLGSGLSSSIIQYITLYDRALAMLWPLYLKTTAMCSSDTADALRDHMSFKSSRKHWQKKFGLLCEWQNPQTEAEICVSWAVVSVAVPSILPLLEHVALPDTQEIINVLVIEVFPSRWFYQSPVEFNVLCYRIKYDALWFQWTFSSHSTSTWCSCRSRLLSY